MTTQILSAGVSGGDTWNLNGMQFDAWLNLSHNNTLTITSHPVETGANITDHSFVNPKRFTFDIGMTDCATFPAISGTGSRSVNAYQALVKMMESRELLSLDSKYGFYDAVLIESIDVSDDWQTKNALKASITLVEVILAATKSTQVSTNPHATDTTNRGKVSPVPPLGSLERIYYDLKKLVS